MTFPQPSPRLKPFRPTQFGRYTLLSPLAIGGMGEISLARLEGAQGFEKLCVIKKILPQLAEDQDFVERFVNEAKILVKLSHGSIAQVLDMGVHEGALYIALEFVDGKDLRKVLGRGRDAGFPLPLTFILYVMGRVLDALAYAHRKKDDDDKLIGLVHRDVSPQNILVSYEGEVKVIDFGLAKSTLNVAKTNPSIILGKFLYMSPEQARHQGVDKRSDLYAVGLCLYELITGKNPFDDVSPGELMARVATPRIRPLGEVDPLCPGSVQALVAKALTVDPAQRFQTAEEFRGKLMACLVEIDPAAGPETVSRYVRESFAADYQAERKLLASLKELRPAVAAPEPMRKNEETAITALPPPDRTRSVVPLKPQHSFAGPVDPTPLSFDPTPRTGPFSLPHPDGETMPGIVLDEHTHPGQVAPTVELILDVPGVPWTQAPSPDPAPYEEPRTDALAPVVPSDTQPRVVLGLLLDEPPPEAPQPQPPPQPTPRPRTLPPVALAQEPTGEITRDLTTGPQAMERSFRWVWTAAIVGMLALIGFIGFLTFKEYLKQTAAVPLEEPPRAGPAALGKLKPGPVPPVAVAVAPAVPAPAPLPTPPPVAAGVPLSAPAPVPATAVAAPAAAAEPAPSKGAEPDEVAPLSMESEPPPPSRTRDRVRVPAGPHRGPKRGAALENKRSAFQREWNKTRAAYEELERRRGVEQLGILAQMYERLRNDYATSDEDASSYDDLQRRMRDIQKRVNDINRRDEP